MRNRFRKRFNMDSLARTAIRLSSTSKNQERSTIIAPNKTIIDVQIGDVSEVAPAKTKGIIPGNLPSTATATSFQTLILVNPATKQTASSGIPGKRKIIK